MTEAWTAAQWEEWRAENRRLLAAGARLETNQMLDGSTECWVELYGKRWRRDPKWDVSPEGDHYYGAV